MKLNLIIVGNIPNRIFIINNRRLLAIRVWEDKQNKND